MSCRKFKEYETGKLNEADFQSHLEVCARCRELMREDARLMSLAGSLKQPVQEAGLWQRIEETLRQEHARREQQGERIELPVLRRVSLPLRLAAAFALIFVFAGLFWLLFPGKDSGLLDQAALQRVEKKEIEYVAAISELEERIRPRLDLMDIDAMLLYKEKLETIDERIEALQEAAGQNPANTHIRRHMLAALQDKRQTLKDILNYRPHQGQ